MGQGVGLVDGWNYKVVTNLEQPRSLGETPQEAASHGLQELGREGWELVLTITAGGKGERLWVFKRPSRP